MDWKNEVTLEMLPAAHRKLAEVIGVQATLQLCETFGGETMYVPLTDAVYATGFSSASILRMSSRTRWVAVAVNAPTTGRRGS